MWVLEEFGFISELHQPLKLKDKSVGLTWMELSMLNRNQQVSRHTIGH